MRGAYLSGHEAGSKIHASPAQVLQRKCACGTHTVGGGECEACRQKDSRALRRSAASTAPRGEVPPVVGEVLGSPGQRLEQPTRSLMESRFGQDFSHVRVHTDARAAESARAVDALAYTIGQDVVFGAGQFAPETTSGRKLLAHELAHTIQQGDDVADLNQSWRVGTPADASEREADRVADTVHQAGGESSGREMFPARQPFVPDLRVAPGTIQRQGDGTTPRTPPAQTRQTPPARNQQTPSPPQSQQTASPQPAPRQTQAADLRTRVRQWLDGQHFSLPIVADARMTPPGEQHVFYGGERRTLDNVADDVADVLRQTTPGLRRPDVWSQVWQYYNEKKLEAERDRWQTVIQVLYTPQLTFASNQPPTPGASPWQHGLQVSAGRNLRLHPVGANGLEFTFQASVSLFNLGSGHPQTGDDAFQNAMLAAQLQHVWNLGREFRIAPGQWANVQASLFLQVAAGLGTSYEDVMGGDRRIHVGFLAQPSAGGQVNLNIGWFQIIAQGSVVYSYLSPTTQAGSAPQHSGAVQLGLGLGAQF